MYVPGRLGIVDALHPDDGLSLWGGKSLEELRAKYPGAVVGTWDDVPGPQPWTNERGNLVTPSASGEYGGCDRYLWDFQRCKSSKGWRQFDTSQDASYFGVWVHVRRRKIVTFCEGDLSRVTCPTPESFRAELRSMCEFYGEQPPAWVAIDADGTCTRYLDAESRPAILREAGAA